MIIYKNKVIPHLFKCAGSSLRKTLVKYDIKNLQKISEHDAKYTLDSMQWAKDFNVCTLVRHPYAWYESLYNYHKDMPIINALSTITERKVKSGVLTQEIKDIDEWLEAVLDLPKFFKENENAQDMFIKELSGRKGFQDSWFMNKPLTELSHQDYVGSFYALQVEKLLPDNTKTFKMETEMSQFLSYIGFNQPLMKNNITKDKSITLTQKHKDMIYEADKELFERFNYKK